MSNPLSVRSVERSHIGSVRGINEDRVFNCAERRLWAVADGMGGHSKGDIAAELVVTALAELAADSRDITPATIDAALDRANAQVRDLNGINGDNSGATIAGLHLADETAYIFWAGDSRVYRQRGGVTELLTHDHRLVQDMIDAGVIDARQARTHPRATVITRAIGAIPEMLLSSRHEPALPGDIYLICSDGLTDMIEDATLADLMDGDSAGAANDLVQAALRAGGTDNISVVVVSLTPDVHHQPIDQAPLAATRF